MSKIIIVGKMKNEISIEGESINIKDSINNLPNDFIISIMKEIINKSGCDYKKNYKFNREFQDEIIRDVKGEIICEQKTFKVTVSRKTYNDTPLIECIIDYNDEENLLKYDDSELFGSAYKFKIDIKNILKEYCKKIYWLVDENNTKICTSSYLKIHEIENKFRQMLSLFMMKKCGDIYLNKKLEETYSDYSKFYYDSKYLDFRDINSKLYNLDFSSLPEILKMTTPQAIINEENNITLLVEEISEELSNIENITYSYKKIEKMRKKLNTTLEKMKREDFIFDDEIKFSESIRDILDENFEKQWKKLSGMRNMVMHNKPICDKLYKDINNTYLYVDEKISKCLDKINRIFYTEEEHVYDCLCDEAAENEQYEFEFIEQERENVGIDFPLNEDYVLEMLAENQDPVQNLIESINKFVEIDGACDDIICELDNLSDIIDAYTFEGLKLRVEENLQIINISNEEVKSCEDIEEIKDIVFRYILKGKTIDDLYEISEVIKVEDYFSIDNLSTIVDYHENKYEIYFQGELNPGNGETDYIECTLLKNNMVEKRGQITVYYGDYSEPSEGYIDTSSLDDINEVIIEVYKETMNEIKWIKDKINDAKMLF